PISMGDSPGIRPGGTPSKTGTGAKRTCPDRRREAVSQASRGWLHLRFLNRAQSRSVVIHSQPAVVSILVGGILAVGGYQDVDVNQAHGRPSGRAVTLSCPDPRPAASPRP